MPFLINAAQLEKFRKNQNNIVILDASWHLPEENRHAKDEFAQKHIVGARFFDIDAFHDQHNPLPNMLTRDEELIAKLIGELGISNDHKIVFYDQSKLHTSCRALWMLKVFGHNPNLLYILDGGLSAWTHFGGKVETGPAKQTSTKRYTVDYVGHFVRTLLQMKTNLHHPQEQVVDMRHAVRFAGGNELRPGLRSGHIPGSYCFPATTMFESNGQFKPLEKIRKQLSDLGLDLHKPIVTTCGSGMTAATLNFVLDLLDDDIEHALYDGSWSEWGVSHVFPHEGDLDERPVATSLES